MPSKPRSIRFKIEDMETWDAWARTQGLSFNKWVVRACKGQYETERAEANEKEEAIAQREALNKAAFPQPHKTEKCRHVPPGNYCYRCGVKRW